MSKVVTRKIKPEKFSNKYYRICGKREKKKMNADKGEKENRGSM